MCKRIACNKHFTTSEKRHAIIGIRQRDADKGLGSSGTLEPAGIFQCGHKSECPALMALVMQLQIVLIDFGS